MKEYWIVDPGNEVLHLYKLQDQMKYIIQKIYSKDEVAISSFFNGLEVPLEKVFL